MQRELVTPADLSGAPLAELKDWLAITTTRDDAALLQLLASSMATCEAFTRSVALESTYEEVREAGTDWQTLSLSPVRSITQLEAIATDGARSLLDAGQYLVDIASNSCGRFRLLTVIPETHVAVRYSAGQASNWAALHPDLRHGILRLAAHHFRERESEARGTTPPAAIVALWQPHRRLRLV